MDRKFQNSYASHNAIHRWNPFNRMLRNRVANTLSSDPGTKALFTSPVLDQGQLDRCTAYCMCALRAAVTGQACDTAQYWADEMAYENEPSGVDARTAAAASIDPGWKNMATGLYERADAVLWIYPNGGMDMFDSMNAAMMRYQSPCAVGFEWYSDWETTTGGVLGTDKPTIPLGGHLTMFCGPKGEDLVNQNSWGRQAPGSDQGFYYFPRSVINSYVEGYPCFIPFTSDDRVVKILGAMSSALVRIADLLN